MARAKGRKYMSWVRSFKKNSRRRRRRNPYPIAGVALNPRRRRRSYRRNPGLLNRRRRYSRNPRTIAGIAMPPLQSVLYVGAGFIGPPIVEGFLVQFLPTSLTGNTLGKYAVRIGSVLGLSWLAKIAIGRREALMVGVGGGAYTLISAIKEFAPGVIPGLSAYTPSMGAYTRSSLGAPNYGAVRPIGAASAPFGGANIVGARFRRFA